MTDKRDVEKPQVNISRSTKGRMWLICFCAALVILQSASTDGGASAIVALCALSAAILVELLITSQTHGLEKIKDGSAAASALVFSLFLPNMIHPIYAVLGAVFAVVVIKHSFGGLGSNWLNPSIGAYLFVRFSWPSIFSDSLKGSVLDTIGESISESGATDAPMRILAQSGYEAAGNGSVDEAVSSFLNSTIFSIPGVELPQGYIDLLMMESPGIIADRGLLALLAGTIIIIAFQISRSWIPAVFMGTFGVLVWIFGGQPFGSQFFSGDVLFAFFTGGTFAAAFIAAADPATGAKSIAGSALAACLGGLFAWMFRYGAFEWYGAFFAIALVNAINPIVRFLEGHWFFFKAVRKAPVGGR